MTGIIMSAVLSMGGQGGGMAGPGFGMLMNPWVQEELGFTAEQTEKLSQIITDHMTATATIRADLMAKRLELRTELNKDKPDMKAVEKLTGEIGNLQARMLMERIRMEVAIKNLLTEEQKAKLKELKAIKPGKGKGKGGKGGKGKGGKGPGPTWF